MRFEPNTHTAQLNDDDLAVLLSDAHALIWDEHLCAEGFATVLDGSSMTFRLGDRTYRTGSAEPKPVDQMLTPSDKLAPYIKALITSQVSERAQRSAPIPSAGVRVVLQRVEASQVDRLISEYGVQDTGVNLSTVIIKDDSEDRYCNEGGATLITGEDAQTLRALRDRISRGEQPGAQQSGEMTIVIEREGAHYILLMRDALPIERADGIVSSMSVMGTICY